MKTQFPEPSWALFLHQKRCPSHKALCTWKCYLIHTGQRWADNHEFAPLAVKRTPGWQHCLKIFFSIKKMHEESREQHYIPGLNQEFSVPFTFIFYDILTKVLYMWERRSQKPSHCFVTDLATVGNSWSQLFQRLVQDCPIQGRTRQDHCMPLEGTTGDISESRISSKKQGLKDYNHS